MARQSQQERLAQIHYEALVEFDEIQSALRDERLQCLQDRRFAYIAGAQWEGPLGEQFENKPRFEFNKVHLAVIRVINEYRNNRITVDFQPRDGSADDDMADTCDGLFRADERACTADEAYDNAYEEGTSGGFGAWRLRACYEDEDDDEDERQRVVMQPIFDADSTVFFDLAAKRYDKADAKRCFVLTPYPRRAYEAEFDDSPSSWPKDIHQSEFDWCTPDLVWVCELYRIEEGSELVRFFRGLDEEAPELRVTEAELDDDPAMLDELLATGFREVRQKKVRRCKVMKYTMTGGKIFATGEHKPQRIAGRCIPVIPFYGKRWVIDGVERCMGHVRLAKDAQRLMNSLLSWLADMAGRFDIEKPILSPEQIAGHAEMWAADNVSRFPYLLANALRDAEGNPVPGTAAPQAYTKAPNIPPAMAALVQIASQALEELLGNQQAGEQLQPNLSGKAVELIQNRLDMQVFIYMSNLAKSMKRSGEVWLSMMKDIAVEQGRRMKVIDANGNASSVVLNQPAYDPETATEYVENDLSKASFEVDVDVGPSSSSKRSATVRALTGMLQLTQDPETQAVLSGLAMMNMEGEGINDARDYFRRKLVRMGVIKPSEREKEELAAEQQGAQPDPQAQALLAMAEEASANAGQARANTVRTIADADLKRAQTAKTIAETMGAQEQQQLASAQALQEMLQASPRAVSVPNLPPPVLPGV
jgi:hypothetical protein